MSSSHEIQATINAIGFLDEGEYFKGNDCTNALKDLARYLKRDDPNEKTIRRELLKSDVISNDLIPLLKIIKPKKESLLFDIVLRLLVNLTQSALNCFELKVPNDKFHYNIFLEIDNQLKRVKNSFADEGFIQVLSERIDAIMRKEWQERPEEEELILERILYLIRNILLIKCSEDDADRLETDINSHDNLILNFFKTDLTNHLIYIAHSNINKKYTIHILEIINLMLREQSAEELAKVSENEVNLKSKRSQVEKERDIDELELLQRKDLQLRKHNRLRLNPRHSRFMGTYVAVNMKSINDENKLIVHKHAKNMDDALMDSSKKTLRKAKNKIVLELSLKDLTLRKSLDDDEMCFFYWLVQFFTEFARNSEFDEQTKMDLIKETFGLELFHSIEIFTQRCFEMIRVDKENNKLWAKRMHTSLKCYKENLINLFAIEKKLSDFKNNQNQEQDTNLTNLATNMYIDDEDQLAELSNKIPPSDSSQSVKKEFLDENSLEIVQKLKNQLFYIQEFREFFIKILKDFDHTKMSKNFLRDLIEANHIFILMLESHKKCGNLNVASKKKKRKTKKKEAKKSVKESKEVKEKRLLQEEEYQRRLDEQDSNFKSRVWDKNFVRVASLIQGQSEFNIENDNLMPFDFVATSDEEFDSHKNTVIEKIQNLLAQNKPDDSISLFREARYLFLSDKISFGTSEMSADEEFEAFKNLFFKTLDINREEINDETKDEGLGDDEEVFCDEKDELYYEEFGDQEETSTAYVVEEENLDFDNFLFRYSHPKILKSYFLMLGEYGKNSDFLNRCCMSLLERIAYECQTPQCLYQLSFFNLINKIYKDPMSRCCMNIIEKNTQKKSIDDLHASTYSTEDMFAFFRKILSKFFEQTTKNPLLFLEILFFKDKKILHELGEEYSGYKNLNAEVNNGKNRKIAWTQEEQDELKELFEKYKRRFETNETENYDDDIEDAINVKNQDAGDIIDLIMLNLKDGNRKRKDICTQLANLGCVHSVDVFKTNRYTFPNRKRMGRNRLWRDEDVDELRHSFFIISDEANQLNRPLHEMMGKLQACLKINRTKSCIIEKLLNLGLVKSKSELVGSKKKGKKNGDDNDGFIDDDDDDDHNDGESKKEKKKKKKDKKSKKIDANNDLFDAESESSSDESVTSESEAENSENEDQNEAQQVTQDKELSDKSDKENSPVKLKGLGTRDKVLEALNLNDDSNELNIIKNNDLKKYSSNNEDDDDNQLIQDILEKKNKKIRKKINKVISDESDEDFEKQTKKKPVAKKRKKVLDSDEDSKDSVASKDSLKKSSQISEKEKLNLLKSDEESDEDEISSSLASKRQKLFLSEDDE